MSIFEIYMFQKVKTKGEVNQYKMIDSADRKPKNQKGSEDDEGQNKSSENKISLLKILLTLIK